MKKLTPEKEQKIRHYIKTIGVSSENGTYCSLLLEEIDFLRNQIKSKQIQQEDIDLFVNLILTFILIISFSCITYLFYK